MTSGFITAAAIILIALMVIGAIYITCRFHRFSPVQKLSKKSRLLSWALSLIPIAVCVIFAAVINIYSAIVIFLHLFVIWVICDIAGFIIKRISKKSFRKYTAGIVAIIITVIYIGSGFFASNHVFITKYRLETEKDIGSEPLRIAQFSDAHLCASMSSDKFSREMERLSQENPDIVVITGDFVDDMTKKEDMLKACEALGNLHTTYGVYYVFGNHDKGSYASENFTTDELRAALTENSVTILEDEALLVDGRFYIVGRQDRSVKSRSSAMSLTQELDSSKYIIMLNHQPNDYKNESETNADLVLSGHTHGGQIFPIGIISLMIKANDNIYGVQEINGTEFIVTSGISGWAMPFKTGTFSEIVITDIYGK